MDSFMQRRNVLGLAQRLAPFSPRGAVLDPREGRAGRVQACCARRSTAASSLSAPAAPTRHGTSKTTRAISPAWTSPWPASWPRAVRRRHQG